MGESVQLASTSFDLVLETPAGFQWPDVAIGGNGSG